MLVQENILHKQTKDIYQIMKKLLVALTGLALAGMLTVQADDAAPAKKKGMSDEAKALRKEMVAKYDANKDGKLDKDEIAKMSAEDKEKCDKAGLHLAGGHKKKAQ